MPATLVLIGGSGNVSIAKSSAAVLASRRRNCIDANLLRYERFSSRKGEAEIYESNRVAQRTYGTDWRLEMMDLEDDGSTEE